MPAPRMSLRSSATSAASTATSVPEASAMPMSAWASAGASLMPSPTIATTWPAASQPLDLVPLAGGQHPGHHLVDAEAAGDAPSGARLIPGQQHRRETQGAHLRDGLRRLGAERVVEDDRADDHTAARRR